MSISNYILYNVDKSTLTVYQFDEVIDALYYQKARVPTEEQVKKYMESPKDKKIGFLFKNSVKAGVNKIKDEISKIDYKVPLYDEYTHNLFIVDRSNVYNRVVHQHYRFPNDALITILKKRLKKYEDKMNDTILKKRERRKLTLMLDFINQFNLEILENTYIKVFYYYSNKVGKDITVCIRPSFMPLFNHIKPFYTRSELINLGLNIGLIKESKTYYDEKRIVELCETVKKNDISSKIILKHHKHIICYDKIGILQYYTLQGSYFLNQYMRGLATGYKNDILEEKTKSISDLIESAPAFDKSYIVYRFVKDDSYLKHLKVGDEYVDSSFISTTRDPFYSMEEYQFGFILIKIKIPKDVVGVALCIETVSNFPKEEEIIFPPKTVLKLNNKDSNVPYYHIDQKYQGLVKTRYEFTYIGKRKLEFPVYKQLDQNKNSQQLINFLHIESGNDQSLKEDVAKFVSRYTDELLQFKTKIGDKVYTMITEIYDSTSAYKDYYAAKTNDGFIIYTFIGNYIGLTVELVEDSDGRAMYVNYYFRHSTIPSENKLEDDDLTQFIGKVAAYFNITTVIIYCTYKSCNFIRNSNTDVTDCNNLFFEGGNYTEDFYDYLKYNKKKYNVTGIKAGFDYEKLNSLHKASPKIVLSKDDRDELYQIYSRMYEPNVKDEDKTVAKFYIWLIETHCQYTKYLTDKLYRLFINDNPFDKDYYVMNTVNFIKGKNLMSTEKLEKKKLVVQSISKIKHPNKNKYRLQINNNSRTYSTRSTRQI